LGENNLNTATSFNNIGSLYNRKGEHNRALECFKKSLQIRLKSVGENHPDTANTYNNIGGSHQNKREYNKTNEYFKKDYKYKLRL
jgi:tetratricopeptide (TPR) repeat protein